MKYLIIDCDAVCYALYHKIPNLVHQGHRTEIVYGFINQLFHFQRYNKADRLIFAWDSKFSIRKNLYSGYKSSRDKVRSVWTPIEKESYEVARAQFKLIRARVLPALGFANIFYQPGYEGDDIIASVVHSLEGDKFGYIKIIARDKDLFQLLSPNCVMYDWVDGRLHTPETFFDTYSLMPNMWNEIRAISGCSTDDVPGIKGIGEGYAIKYLKGMLGHKSKAFYKIKNGCDEIELSRLLTTLPFDGTNQFRVLLDDCTPYKLRSVANEYGFKSLLGKLTEFGELFCEKKTGNTKRFIS